MQQTKQLCSWHKCIKNNTTQIQEYFCIWVKSTWVHFETRVQQNRIYFKMLNIQTRLFWTQTSCSPSLRTNKIKRKMRNKCIWSEDACWWLTFLIIPGFGSRFTYTQSVWSFFIWLIETRMQKCFAVFLPIILCLVQCVRGKTSNKTWA